MRYCLGIRRKWIGNMSEKRVRNIHKYQKSKPRVPLSDSKTMNVNAFRFTINPVSIQSVHTTADDQTLPVLSDFSISTRQHGNPTSIPRSFDLEAEPYHAIILSIYHTSFKMSANSLPQSSFRREPQSRMSAWRSLTQCSMFIRVFSS
jgi:hypothetical protein